MITLETQEKSFVICIMMTHDESWRPSGSPRRERIKCNFYLNSLMCLYLFLIDKIKNKILYSLQIYLK